MGTCCAAATWRMRSTDDPSSRSSSAVTTRCTEVSSHAGSGAPHGRGESDAATLGKVGSAADSRRSRGERMPRGRALGTRIRRMGRLRLISLRDRARQPACDPEDDHPRRGASGAPILAAGARRARHRGVRGRRPASLGGGSECRGGDRSGRSAGRDRPAALALPEQPRVLVFGDSWTYGSAASLPTLGYAYVLGERLGWETTVDGVRGSGYLKPGPDGGSYGERIAALDPALDPDLVIVEGSINDRRLPATGYRDAVAAWDALAALYPEAAIVILGPRRRCCRCRRRPPASTPTWQPRPRMVVHLAHRRELDHARQLPRGDRHGHRPGAPSTHGHGYPRRASPSRWRR